MSIVTARREQEQKQEHFQQYILYFVNPNMWTVTDF